MHSPLNRFPRAALLALALWGVDAANARAQSSEPFAPGIPSVAAPVVGRDRQGRVTAVAGRMAVISMGRADGIVVDQHIEILTTLADSSRTSRVVGDVVEVRASESVVELGIGEAVRPAARAYVTALPLSRWMLAPPRSAPVLATGAGLRLLAPTAVSRGGLVGELWVSAHFRSPYALRVRAFPVAGWFGAAGSGSSGANAPTGLFALLAEALYDSQYVAIGFGVGAGHARGPSNYPTALSSWTIVPMVSHTVRVGATDGTNLVTSVRVDAANGQLNLDSLTCEIQVHMANSFWPVARAGASMLPFVFAEAGARFIVFGNGGAGSLFAAVTVGWAGWQDTFWGQFGAGPLVGIASEYRLGL